MLSTQQFWADANFEIWHHGQVEGHPLDVPLHQFSQLCQSIWLTDPDR